MYLLIIVVVLLLAYMLSWVRLAMVTIVFFFSHYVLYHHSPTLSFAALHFPGTLSRSLLTQSSHHIFCFPWLIFHFFDIWSLPVFHLPYFPHGSSFYLLLANFFLKLSSTPTSAVSSSIHSVQSAVSSYQVILANLRFPCLNVACEHILIKFRYSH